MRAPCGLVGAAAPHVPSYLPARPRHPLVLAPLHARAAKYAGKRSNLRAFAVASVVELQRAGLLLVPLGSEGAGAEGSPGPGPVACTVENSWPKVFGEGEEASCLVNGNTRWCPSSVSF